ncbi:MAG: hypothetical protein KDA28_03920, partial [Phycisphaerales bacterium]|nr:hypothetical protein [Phycisphaerales bacterium]
RVDAGQAFDYDAPVDGMRIIDDHTFVFELNKNEQQFMWRLAMFQLSIVPREAVEHYGTNFNRHPVGTGPFILKQERDWVANTSVLYHRNPHYRTEMYPTEWMPEDEAAGLTASAGATLPLVDKVEFNFFVETQPNWLRFREGEMDFTTVPADNFFEAYDRRTKELRSSWERRGIVSHGVPLLDMIFRGFNMEDSLLGGYTPEKRALRHAICLATDLYEMNESRYNGTAIVYDGPIPPGLDGHPENHILEHAYQGPDYERARQKLREAGYTVVDGKVTDLPTIEFYTSRGAESEKIVALLQRSLEVVGIRLNPHYQDFAALMGTVDNRKAPMFSFAWGSDYPDAENNLALFYGPNESPGSNHYNYKNPEYDRLYEQIKTMPPGPERTAVYVKMRDMIIEDAPFSGSMARVRHYLVHPWLKNFKPTEDFFNYFKYLDVDLSHPRRPE